MTVFEECGSVNIVTRIWDGQQGFDSHELTPYPRVILRWNNIKSLSN